MNEATKQALIRIVRLAIVAVIGIVIANGAVIINLIPDNNTKYLLSLVLVPVLDGLAKLIGGPTEQAAPVVGMTIAAVKENRPSFLSV